MGRYLLICIERFPKHESLKKQLRSLKSPHFARYERKSFSEKIPVIGWFLLKSRVKSQGSDIPFRYPFIELLNGFIFVLLYWLEVPVSAEIKESCLYTEMMPEIFRGAVSSSTLFWVNLRYLFHLFLFEALIIASFIDLDLQIIPDGSTLPFMLIGLLGNWFSGCFYLVPVWFHDPSMMSTLKSISPEWTHFLMEGEQVASWIFHYPHLHGLLVSIMGIIVGGGVVWGVRLIGHWVLKREAMGFGDVILLAMIGSFIGWQPVLVVFFLAPVSALIVVILTWLFKPGREIPYGPYLSLATVVVLLKWPVVWPFAERIYDLGPLVIIMGLTMAGLLAVCLFFMQIVKRLLGISLYDSAFLNEWTSADQLFHFSGEKINLDQGNWKKEHWEGLYSSRGQAQQNQWKKQSPFE